jgi:release factor glutamine methyltransferase
MNLDLKLSNKVFKPTGTSELLFKSTIKQIKKVSKILDLGCGSGYVGLSIAKNSKLKNKYYFSDVSSKAVKLTKINSKENKISAEIKVGSLFKPWEGYKFDIIVNDVSGISQKLNKITPWYNKHITNFSGNDGTDLTINFLNESSKFLEKNGSIIFPAISLSNYKKVLTFAKKKFKIVKKINTKNWPIPKEMYKHEKKINELSKKKFIFIEKKFGLIIFKTDIYIAKSKK